MCPIMKLWHCYAEGRGWEKVLKQYEPLVTKVRLCLTGVCTRPEDYCGLTPSASSGVH